MGKVRLGDLLDLQQARQLLNDFYEATGLPIGIIQADGEILAKSKWQTICERFHRKNPQSLANCLESDKRINEGLNKQDFISYKCLNGLVDAAIPIIIEGEHAASVFFGQFFYKGEEGSEEEFRQQAKRFGFPEEEYIKAYREIPVYSPEKVKKIMQFCNSLVFILSEMGKKNLQLRQELQVKKEYEQKLNEQKKFLESIYAGTSAAIFVMDVTEDGRFIYRGLNPAHEKTSGFKSKELEGKTPDELSDLIPPAAIKEIKAHYQKCLDTGSRISYEEMIPMLGKEVWWLTTLTPIKDESGRIGRIIGSALDITALKETQNELENHKQNLEEMVAQQTEELRTSNEQLLEEVNERRIIQEDRERILRQTQERVKEMACLNAINALLDNEQNKLGDVCQKIVELIPPAWFYPEHTWCRMHIDKEVYESRGFRLTDYFYKTDIHRNDEKVGELKVYLMREDEERQFLSEEKDLLKNIGISISNTITKLSIRRRLKEVKQATEYSQNGFALGDLQGNIYEVNPVFCQMWGAKEGKEVLGRNYMEFLADTPKAKLIVPAMMKDGHWRGEITARKLDGSTFEINLMANLVLDENGEVIALAAYFEDITQRLILERQLKVSEERYRSIFESVTDAIFICDKEGNFVAVNQAAADIYGYARDELLTMSPRDLVREDYSHVLEDFFQTVTQGKIFRGETIDVRKDGSNVNTSVTGRSFMYLGELHIIAVVHDLTSLKKAQREVDKFFEISLHLLCIANTDGYFRRLNPAWTELLGWQERELLETPFIEFVHPEDVEPTLKEVEKLAQGSRAINFINRYRCKDGSYKWLNWTTTPHEDILYAVAIDITSLKESEEKLQTAMAELERSNKDLENFAYVASHDLQEPLRKTASFTQLLAQRYGGVLDERAGKYIDYIVDGTMRMQALIQGLLKFSRVSTHGKEFLPVKMDKVIEVVLDNLSLKIEEKEGEVNYQGLPQVYADENQMISLMQNLISNALKFTRDEPPRITIKAKPQKDKWLFSISDNGIGIDKNFAEKIFIIFQRLHKRNEYPGSGIGLAVCKKIIERHGGKIWFDSIPGEGTTFYFYLNGIPQKGRKNGK